MSTVEQVFAVVHARSRHSSNDQFLKVGELSVKASVA